MRDTILIGSREFRREGKTYIMGILNVTPDSFSDGGRYATADEALFHAERMIADGADIIDIGGESTRPGHTAVGEAEEIDRVSGVIEAIKRQLDAPISLDTYKAAVACEGLRLGADMINDIWGLKYDDGEMARVVAESGAAYCLMHDRRDNAYNDLIGDICADIDESLSIARRGGIGDDRIIIDPGIGFGKDVRQNLAVLARLRDFRRWGLPVLLGASRKSVIGKTLSLPENEREEGTIALSVKAAMDGVTFVRVHDVRANARAIKMIEAVLEEGNRWTK